MEIKDTVVEHRQRIEYTILCTEKVHTTTLMSRPRSWSNGYQSASTRTDVIRISTMKHSVDFDDDNIYKYVQLIHSRCLFFHCPSELSLSRLTAIGSKPFQLSNDFVVTFDVACSSTHCLTGLNQKLPKSEQIGVNRSHQQSDLPPSLVFSLRVLVRS